jgi:serine/threonine protein kinase
VRTLGGRYRLHQRVGVGGMSEVWRGHDRVLDRPVAVKILSPDKAADTATRQRLRAEARSAARLCHPNVAGVYDFGFSSFEAGRRSPYIVMELVEGATLAQHLVNGRLDWRIAARVCAEVSAALAAAHANDIVHRDIKPANVMLTPTGAKVLDFGIAASAGERDQGPDRIVLGTPAYVAPERLNGAPAVPATDMYALGVLLYHCLSGRLPWRAETGSDLLYSHRHLRPDPLPPIEGMPTEVAEVCRDCLDKLPGRRPSSLLAALILAETADIRLYLPSICPPPTPRLEDTLADGSMKAIPREAWAPTASHRR